MRLYNGFVMVMVLMMMPKFVFALTLDSPQLVFENNAGAKHLEGNSAIDAQTDITRAMKNNPDNPVLNLNLGLSFAKQGLLEKSEQSWKMAAKTARNADEKFYAYFNLGAISQAAKKKEEALKYYELALEQKPNSKETKINIELLVDSGSQQQGKGEGSGDQQDKEKSQDPKEGEDQKDKDKQDQEKKEKEGKQYAKNKKQQPKPFKSDQLDQGDVNKILGELKQQEQRIRGEFHKADQKESTNEKDW